MNSASLENNATEMITGYSDRLVIAICTYNEIENIPLIHERLRTCFPDAAILVVDDNSPDGTGRWCDEQAQRDTNFHVIHRQTKSGLGSATMDAFRFAIEKNYEWILTMDGDMSHNPAEAVDVLNRIQSADHQISIGSRYVPGGRIEGWPLLRHLMSKCINGFARLMIGIRTRDCSSAFRCYQTSFLKKIDFSRIRGMGYAYLEELLWFAKCFRASVVEAPIVFRNRLKGKSKINSTEAIRAVWILLKIGVCRCLGIRHRDSTSQSAIADSDKKESSV